jgi:hypothetical protein
VLTVPNGTWTASNEANRFSYNSATDTYTKNFTPTTFYNRNGIGKLGFLVKAKDGTGDRKSQDNFVEVGAYQVTLTTPLLSNNYWFWRSLSISANNTAGNASYVLKANGATLNTNGAT